MKISEYVNSCDFAKQLPQLNTLLNSAEAEISPYGERELIVIGYEDSIALDTVVTKVFDASQQRSEDDDLKTEERIAGIEITSKLRKFYIATDTLLSEASWFTRLSNKVREFSFSSHRPRSALKAMNDHFCGYSEDKFHSTFGGTACHGHLDCEGSYGNSRIMRYMAYEKSIRGKLLS